MTGENQLFFRTVKSPGISIVVNGFEGIDSDLPISSCSEGEDALWIPPTEPSIAVAAIDNGRRVTFS